MKRMLLLWRVAGHDLRLLWFALHHRSRPAWLLPAAALLGFFAIEPANFAIPLVGAIDDLVLLPILLHTMLTFLSPGIRMAFNQRVA